MVLSVQPHDSVNGNGPGGNVSLVNFIAVVGGVAAQWHDENGIRSRVFVLPKYILGKPLPVNGGFLQSLLLLLQRDLRSRFPAKIRRLLRLPRLCG